MKMKKLFCLLLTLCMVCAMVPVSASAAEEIDSGSCGEDASWVLTDDGVLTISGSGVTKDYKQKPRDPNYSNAPWSDYLEQIKTLVIEPGITGIGAYSFYNCTEITSVSLPEGLLTLGDCSFMGCSGITSITLPESLQEIGPMSMYRMGGLTELAIPAAVTVIGEDAVHRLSSLKQFRVAAENPNFSSDETGVLYSKDKTVLLAFPGGYEGAYAIPSGVTAIGRIAFDSCKRVTEVEIPASVTEIRVMAFSFCDELHKIRFKGDAPAIDGEAFTSLNTVVYYPADNATWTEDVTDYYYGSDLILWEPVGDCVHTAESGVVTKEPACETPGYMTYTCTACGADFYEILPGLDHAWGEGVRSEEYNCEEGGFIRYTCSACEGSRDEELEPTDHIYDDGVVVEPTCTSQGYTKYTCTVCGHVNSVDHVDPIAHTLVVEEVFAPTCTDQGFTLYVCSVCGSEVFDDYVDPTGHTYEETVTLEATCTDDGELIYTCTACGDSYTEVIPALGHTPDAGTVTLEPTCTEDGESAHPCTVCGEIITSVIPALGHSWDEGTVIAEPTCTAVGRMKYVCSVCLDTRNEEIPMISHDFVEGKCSVCGVSQMATPVIESCYSRVQTSVKVTWTISEGADGYELWRTTTPDDEESWTRAKTMVGSDAHIYTNQGLTIGTTYYYKVRAFVEDDEGNRTYTDFSEMDYMPAAVVFNGPYGNSTQRVRLLWNEVGGAHGYQIWRMNEDGSYSVVKTLGDRGNELTNDMGSATAYSNDGLEAGTQYTYKMRAFMIEDGKKVFGAYSDEVTIATMPEAPVVTGTSPRATRAQLTWDAVEGAAGYQIWMAESADGEYKIVKSITDGSTSYTKYDLTSGKTYYFQVRAYTEVEGKKTFGAFSDVVSIDVQ